MPMSIDAEDSERYRQLADEFRRLAETASDIVYAAGADRIVTWVSPSITRAFGWEPEDIVGTFMSDLVHPDDLAWSAERRDRIYAGDAEAEAAGSFTLRLRTKGGSYHWVKTTLTTHRDASGTPAGFTGGMVQIDELIEAREDIARSAALQRLMGDSLLDSLVLITPVRDAVGSIVDFVHVSANRAACEEYRRTAEEMVGIRLSELEPGVESTGLLETYIRVAESGQATVLDAFHYRNQVTGTDRHYDTRIVPVPGDHLSVAWRDVTEAVVARRRLADSEARFWLLAENVSDVVQLMQHGVCTWVSPSIQSTLGWTQEEWLERGFDQLVHPDDRTAMAACQQSVSDRDSKIVRLRAQAHDAAYRWIEVSAGPFVDQDDGSVGIVSAFRVVDEDVAVHDALVYEAGHDALTGVLTRGALLERLGELGGSERAVDETPALLFIDLDEFKAVNDTFGHAVGDDLLRAVATRLQSVVRAEDVVGRLGGDEFLVLLAGARDIHEAVAVAEKIRSACAQPPEVGSAAVATTLSIGVVLRTPGEAGEAVIARADQAMYEAKRAGGNQTVIAGVTA
jgi:diguanylate cyclase (GGDEF)-like protein/PAS domain S-box-containing protein